MAAAAPPGRGEGLDRDRDRDREDHRDQGELAQLSLCTSSKDGLLKVCSLEREVRASMSSGSAGDRWHGCGWSLQKRLRCG